MADSRRRSLRRARGGGGTDPTHGGGGGSISIGTSQANTPGFKTGDGSVTITYTILPETETPSGTPSLSAPSFQVFPSTRPGRTSETATLVIRNIGDGPLEKLSILLSGKSLRSITSPRLPFY